ncbi:TRAF3-interacting JNK-activating modulator isoform X2 [Cololabis saira]|uniref:TRAF3-interacting JNK-activating modulator isoform X2 n=1 Tax=Cololabis saira TaxID=129043 RepID=UPI002AD396AA|nr:TRAF3-interacting JNK-activating modulator isoform X2 [Cololabis saira]
MDALTIGGVQHFPLRQFDQKVDIRAEKREHLRGRNNVTSCRSPTRDFDTRLVKTELKEKRHLEFLRRRSVSPEPSGQKCRNCSSKRKHQPLSFSMKHHNFSAKSETLHTNTSSFPSVNSHSAMILTQESRGTDGPSTSKWASLWSQPITPMQQEKENVHAQNLASVFTPGMMESRQQWTKTINKRDVKKTNITSIFQTEKINQKSSVQTEDIHPKKTLREIGVQTESGLITVKESDVQKLSDYLQEALWREEAVRKKLAALHETAQNLVNFSDIAWTSRCSEDLLRNKLKTLEAQLQVCLQKFPKDGMKKVVQQMEKQSMRYEEKALVALQKATKEKTEALSKAETLQEALITAKAESLQWQSLYQELKLNSGQLRESQHLSIDHLQQLNGQAELSRAREVELQEEVASLRQENQEQRYNICLLEGDNQTLREEVQLLRDGDDESQNFLMQEILKSEEAEPQQTAGRDSELEEQLRRTQEKLQSKEKECKELQTELHVVEQECQSSQTRLSQCRDELRQNSHRRSTPVRKTPCGSWWRTCVSVLLLLSVVSVAMLWIWHPPFRDQVEVLYSDIETRIEDYVMEMASPQHSGCFRPI